MTSLPPSIANNPNAVVLQTRYDHVRDPWPIEKVRAVVKRIDDLRGDVDPGEDVFAFRKACIKEEDILEFQRRHPKMFYMLTDLEKMQVPRYRNAISALIEVRGGVERGAIASGEADAAATRVVMENLSGQCTTSTGRDTPVVHTD